jgi:peptide/nickel transport system permease protein
LTGSGIVLVVLSVSLFASSIAPYNPLDVRFDGHEPPSAQHWLGTDNLGRDILSRILWGARISILFSVAAATLSLVFGSLLGGSSAYLGRVYDELVSKFLDVMLMLPRLLLLILLVAMFGSNLWSTVLVVGLTQSPVAGKLMRGQVLSLRNREYVTAAVVSGASDWRILVRHILPNAMPILITNGTLQIAEAIMLEAGLSFLGLGDPNVISLGQMLNSAQPYLQIAWWSVLFPGMAIAVIVLAFYLIEEDFNSRTTHRGVSFG